MTYSPGECTVVSANEYGVLQALRGEVTRHVVHPTHITYVPPGHAAFITSYHPFEVLDMEGAVCVGPIDMLRHFKPNLSAY